MHVYAYVHVHIDVYTDDIIQYQDNRSQPSHYRSTTILRLIPSSNNAQYNERAVLFQCSMDIVGKSSSVMNPLDIRLNLDGYHYLIFL